MSFRKKINLIVVFFGILIFSKILIGDSFPILKVKPDKRVQSMLDSEPDFKKEDSIEYKTQWKKIVKSIQQVYKEIWNDFISKGRDILPWCIYESFNALKDQIDIKIYFSILSNKKFPRGDYLINPKLGAGGYAKNKIFLYGVYKKEYISNISGKKYCLKAVLFHEMLHFAIDITDRETKYSSFKIRDITNPRKTTNKNIFADEGVIEDCELKLYPCGQKYYNNLRKKSWYKDNPGKNARKYGEPDDDCIECKLCKDKKK